MASRYHHSAYLFPPVNPKALRYLARMKRAEVVCYLDYDGVLHSDRAYQHPKGGIYLGQASAEGGSLFEHAERLVQAFVRHPEIRIVLSTDWVRKLGYTRAKSYLPGALSERVIGATYHSYAHGRDENMTSGYEHASRAAQILADVHRRNPSSWFAIDDDIADWPEHLRANLVACQGATGLGSNMAWEELSRILLDISDPSCL